MTPQPVRTVADLANVIKARRTELGLDQAELAARARVSRLWISEVENGKTGAAIARIMRTLAVLDLNFLIVERTKVAPRVSRSNALITRLMSEQPRKK